MRKPTDDAVVPAESVVRGAAVILRCELDEVG
jgi:hypothetical protein